MTKQSHTFVSLAASSFFPIATMKPGRRTQNRFNLHRYIDSQGNTCHPTPLETLGLYPFNYLEASQAADSAAFELAVAAATSVASVLAVACTALAAAAAGKCSGP